MRKTVHEHHVVELLLSPTAFPVTFPLPFFTQIDGQILEMLST